MAFQRSLATRIIQMTRGDWWVGGEIRRSRCDQCVVVVYCASCRLLTTLFCINSYYISVSFSGWLSTWQCVKLCLF